MADGETLRQRRRGRWQYSAADDVLAEIEAYASALKTDPRPQIPILARDIEEQVAAVRGFLDDGEALFEIGSRASRPESADSALRLAAPFAAQAEPELAIVEFYELHKTLALLQLAEAMPGEELDKLAALEDNPERELGVLDLAPNQDRLADLFRVALRRKRQGREFSEESNTVRHTEAQRKRERWLLEDERLAEEKPHVTKKLARARLIRARLGETDKADTISRALPDLRDGNIR